MFWQRAELVFAQMVKSSVSLRFLLKNGPKMQCNPVFCLEIRHEPLNPVLHFNHEGFLMFLELFHLVYCFEFHMRLGFAGIAEGDTKIASSKFYKP